MPRFFFDLFEGHESVMDSEGLLLAELEEAELEAAGAVAHLMSQRVARADWHSVEVVIRDSERTALSRVSVTVARERIN